MEGNIPDVLTMLTTLTRLDLSGNMLTGTVPAGLTALSRLRYLDLSDNQLVGAPLEWTTVLSNNSQRYAACDGGIDQRGNVFVARSSPVRGGSGWFPFRGRVRACGRAVVTPVVQLCGCIGGCGHRYARAVTCVYCAACTRGLCAAPSSSLFSIVFYFRCPAVYSSECGLDADLELQHLDLSNNALTGTLPKSYGQMHSLT